MRLDGRRSEGRDDVYPDLHFVGIRSAQLHISQVIPMPHIQPLAKGQATVLSVITMVDGDGDFGQLLPDFRLGSAIDRMPFSIGTVSGFPASVSPFSDGSFAVSTLSCPCFLLSTANLGEPDVRSRSFCQHGSSIGSWWRFLRLLLY